MSGRGLRHPVCCTCRSGLCSWMVIASVFRHARGMPARDVSEGHGRTEIDAARGIEAGHDTGHVGAYRVESRDRPAVTIQNLCRGIRLQAGEGSEAAGLHLHGIEGTPLDRRHARIGPVRGIALLPVVGRGTAAEFRVLASPRMLVVGLDRFRQTLGGRCRKASPSPRWRRRASDSRCVVNGVTGTGKGFEYPRPYRR